MRKTIQTRKKYLKTLAAGISSFALPVYAGLRSRSGSGYTGDKPNIILIMADDLGYSDIGCYGGEIHTPNLDKLAAEGMRFTRFYNAAKCAPTRASLLTGQYEFAAGIKKMEHGATFGELLRSAGYRTIISGKWHQVPLPTTRGFDRYQGLADGACNFWNPGTTAVPGEPQPGRKKETPRRWAIEGKAIMGFVPKDKNFYTTDVFTDYAVDRLEEYKDEEKPFLLYVPYTAPHYPLHAWPEDIARYKGKYKTGWDELRKKRYKKLVKMRLLGVKQKQNPRDPDVAAWDTLDSTQKEAAELKMAVYAAMVDRMDQGIGRIIKKLEAIGKKKNTLIMFLSDNGACAEIMDTTPDVPPGPVESYRTLGREWANACNTPYRKYKTTNYEGGTCTPFIASWPGIIKPGSITDQIGHIIDVVPTFMDIAGAAYPEQLEGRKLKAIAGLSLLPVLKGKNRKGHEVLYWKFRDSKAVCAGKWKLVQLEDAGWELYDLDEDRTEMNDLVKKYPEKVKQMSALWKDWWKKIK